jgi:hypothetical protein
MPKNRQATLLAASKAVQNVHDAVVRHDLFESGIEFNLDEFRFKNNPLIR